jgi:hypothetical protein
MIPMTPTPLPPGIEPLSMPDVSLWDSAPIAIQMWNNPSVSAAVLALQAIIVLGLVLAIGWMIMNAINGGGGGQSVADADD